MVALELQTGDARLLPLNDVERDEQVSLLSAVIVVHLRGHLHISKTVRKIQSANRVGVIAHDPLAEAPAGGKRGRLQLQTAGEQVAAEIFVAFKGDTGETKTIATRDFIADHALAVLRVFLRGHLHTRIEIAFSLQ